MSAFANSAGGTLVIGVSEPARTPGGTLSRKVAPCTRPGGQPLDEWATRVLSDLAPYLSPAPRIHVVDHPAGEVLVIATARAPRLVPLVEDGRSRRTTYACTSPSKAHDLAILDLVLERRYHPVVELNARAEGREYEELLGVNGGVFNGLLLSFVLRSCERVAGQRRLRRRRHHHVVVHEKNAAMPHGELLSYIDAGPSPGGGELPQSPGRPLFREPPAWQLQHLHVDRNQNRPTELRPFMEVAAKPVGKALYPVADGGEFEVTAAVYVMPAGAPPSWFEVCFRYRREGVTTQATAVPVRTGRPTIRWRFVG